MKAKKQYTSRNCPQVIKSVNPFLENGVISVDGWMQDAPMKVEVKQAVVSQNDLHFSDLLIEHYHKKIGHAGLSHTFCAVKERF